jgi:8-oxo-dGTP diphosphatase
LGQASTAGESTEFAAVGNRIRFVPEGLRTDSMPVEHVNRVETERRLERLRAEYDDPPVVETTFDVDPAGFAEATANARDGYIGGGYCWVVRTPEQAAPLTPSMPDDAGNDSDRVLLILSRGSNEWGLPGGGLEGYDPAAVEDPPPEPDDAAHGETYEDAARREVAEETGIECRITDCWKIERGTWEPTDDRDVVLHSLFVFFEGTYADGHIAVQQGELDGAAWFGHMPERLHPANEAKAERWEP